MQKFLQLFCFCLLSVAGNAQPGFPDLTAPLMAGNDELKLISHFEGVAEDRNRVALNWKVADSVSTDFLIIERSVSGREFETLAVIKIQKDQRKISWIDEAPRQGRNFYRLKYETEERRICFSPTISVMYGSAGNFKFYPNPVDNVLIIRSEQSLEIQLTDQNGRVRVPKTMVKGLHTLNVSSLEKGIYILRITNLLTNTVVQEKVFKN